VNVTLATFNRMVSMVLTNNAIAEAQDYAKQVAEQSIETPAGALIDLSTITLWNDETNAAIAKLVTALSDNGVVCVGAIINENQFDIMPEENNVLMSDPHNSVRVFFNKDTADAWLQHTVNVSSESEAS